MANNNLSNSNLVELANTQNINLVESVDLFEDLSDQESAHVVGGTGVFGGFVNFGDIRSAGGGYGGIGSVLGGFRR
jgi:hypothetical protein